MSEALAVLHVVDFFSRPYLETSRLPYVLIRPEFFPSIPGSAKLTTSNKARSLLTVTIKITSASPMTAKPLIFVFYNVIFQVFIQSSEVLSASAADCVPISARFCRVRFKFVLLLLVILQLIAE